MTAGHGRTAGVAVGGSLYVLGGVDGAGATSATVERYVLGSAAWTTEPPLPAARLSLAATADSAGTIHVMGGDAGLTDVFALRNGAWAPLASLPYSSRNLAATRMADGRLVALGGHAGAGTTYHRDAHAYDVTANTWTALPSMLLGRSDLAAVFAPDGRLYSLGGYIQSTGARAEVEAYRPGATVWRQLPALQSPRDGCAAAVGFDGRIYVVGGRNATAPQASVEAYGPRFSLAASSGSADGIVTVTGSGFGANAEVRVYFDDMPRLAITASTTGAFTADLHVPSVAAGTYVVRAVDDRMQYPVTATFTTL
jgi:N-acetylneuraminic acid mutarotase